MKQYHVNIKGEAGVCSATKGKCPFGNADAHFSSAEAARSFYETNQSAVVAGARKAVKKLNKDVSPPRTMEAFHAGISSVPEVSDSKVLAPPAVADNDGYLGGRRFIGAARAEIDGFVTQDAASAGLKDLVKKAKASGELPDWLDVSVKKDSGAWVNSLSVTAGYKPEGGRKVRAIPEDWLYEPKDPDSFRRQELREPAKKLEKYLTALGRQYESSDINSMVDYFNSSNAGRFSWRRRYLDKD
jgi:hypothetical protein